MDAGLAAVIAGAAGAGGAALAAFATSHGLLRQAKMQGDSAHRLWLRNHQQQAFEEFLLAVENSRTFFRDLSRSDGPNEPEGMNPLLEEHTRLLEQVHVAITRVTLLADMETGSCAYELGAVLHAQGSAEVQRRLATTGQTATPPTEETLRRLRAEVALNSTKFALKAQKALQAI
ncbi:hypothetical protein ACFWVT_05565 [Streptomyces cyaneofuscatus]|uniref:hypothetical protein n=1 Tax=Streptomyces cyaneofuscatus TaxID=66883 RepID=UPI003666750E